MQIAEPVAGRSANPSGSSKMKDWMVKIALLTLVSVLLGVAQGWAAARTYKPDYAAGFQTGFLHGALMPAALPGLVLGQDLRIYAPNNSGRPYNIGYIIGINTCGTFFFGIAFWQRKSERAVKKI